MSGQFPSICCIVETVAGYKKNEMLIFHRELQVINRELVPQKVRNLYLKEFWRKLCWLFRREGPQIQNIFPIDSPSSGFPIGKVKQDAAHEPECSHV